jgi:hypothetical protein
MAIKDEELDRRINAFLALIEQDQRQWIEQRRAKAQAEAEEKGESFLFWEEPTDKEYATQRLGIDAATFSRWKLKYSPPNEKNTLIVCQNLGTTKPWEIMGFKSIPLDAVDIVARWPHMDQETRESIKRLSGGSRKSSNPVKSPASAV